MMEPTTATSINKNCPRSGKPVAPDSLTPYRGLIVGFCNPGCRDDFAKDPERCVADRRYFDKLIQETACWEDRRRRDDPKEEKKKVIIA